MATGVRKSQFEFLDEKFIPKTLEEVLNVQADIWQKTLVQSLEDKDKVSSGNLAQSINVEVTEEKTKFVFTLRMDDYWKYVDEGRKKGGKQPPQEAMLEFIALRGIQPKAPKTIKPRKKAISQDKLRKSLAFAMAKSIKDNGITASNFYTDEIEGLTKGLVKEVSKSLAKDIKIEFT